MAVNNKIFIPTFISSINYEPVRTLPHVYFYNGLKSSEEYFIQHYPSGSTSSVSVDSQTAFPYFDYYDGLTPNSSSNSLLFFNETPPYGSTPTGSLYTEYWETYVSLLYNPRTRLFNASAIIPLADYFQMELNDIVQWRGNYYHLRAINEYNLKDGTCKIELLGPIIRDAYPKPVFIADCTFDYTITGSIFTYYSDRTEGNGYNWDARLCSVSSSIYPIYSKFSPLSAWSCGDVFYSDANATQPWFGDSKGYGISSTPSGSTQILFPIYGDLGPTGSIACILQQVNPETCSVPTTTTTSTTTTTTSTTTTTIPPPSLTIVGLVSWLQGGTGSYNPTTNIWSDASGNNNTGSVVNGPLSISVDISNGWKFNQSSASYVEWASVMNSQPSTSYTYIISGDFQIPVSGSTRELSLFSKYTANNGWFDTQEVYNPTGNPNPKGRLNQAYDFGAIEGNNRVDFVATGDKQILTFINKPDPSGYWEVYINTGSVGQFSGIHKNWNINSVPMRFGFGADGQADAFYKSVSDLLIYNRILTPQEISDNVNYLLTYNPNNYQPITTTTTTTSTTTTLAPTTTTTTLAPTTTTTT